MPAPDEVNAPLTVRELIEELQELPDQDLPIMFAAISVDDYFDRVAYRMIHQNFTQEYVSWDEGIGEYRVVDRYEEDTPEFQERAASYVTTWVMN
jgi:cytochrome oxidase Cu insertion factor (SCO1/SenC/PrrC family)